MGALSIVVLILVVLTSGASADVCYRTVQTTRQCGWWFTRRRCSATKTVASYCVHGGWSGWSENYRQACSTSCGQGTQLVSYVRYCNNPSPYAQGNQCSGQSTQSYYIYCQGNRCPVNGGWSSWGEFHTVGRCSAYCGYGQQQQQRSRSCSNPWPQNGGSWCPYDSVENRYVSCFTQHCPISGAWASWTGWHNQSPCSVTCGGGTQQQTSSRSCTNPPPQYGGAACSGSSIQWRGVVCNSHQCPIPGAWTSWSSWHRQGTCTVTCGGGRQTKSRSRSCTNPVPQYGGAACSGSNTESRRVDCNSHHCPIPGAWTSWGGWRRQGSCSVTCGGGRQRQARSRSCSNPVPQYGGGACPGSSTQSRNIDCNRHLCPIYGWTSFGEWHNVTDCSATCGGGQLHQSRSRTCNGLYRWRLCAGDSVETRTVGCNTSPCPSPVGEENHHLEDHEDYED